MDNEFNVTYITVSGFVEMNRYRYMYFLIFFTAYILILCSNSVIVYLIWSNKSLHEPMYVFIAALLFNSVLYSTTVYPKLLIDFLSEKQVVSYSACIFQFFMVYTLGGSEFLLLAVMAFDRYVSICKPLRYHTVMTKTTVNIFLALAWLLPACHVTVTSILTTKEKKCDSNMKGIICNNAVFTLSCVRSAPLTVIGVICFFNLAIIPMIFTIFTYAKIFLISYQKCKTFRRKAAETCIPHLLVLLSFSYLAVYDIIIARVESDFTKTTRFIMTLQIFLYHPLFNPFIYGLKVKEIFNCLKRFCSKIVCSIFQSLSK